MDKLFVKGMWGLGDNVYQRPFVRKLLEQYEVWLETPWPEVYEGLEGSLHFVRGSRNLRTQNKNMQGKTCWEPVPPGTPMRQIGYRLSDPTSNMIREMGSSFDLAGRTLPMDLPTTEPWKETKPYALVRPVTLRKEWSNPARNPNPEYIFQAATRLMETHHVISIADVAPPYEEFVGTPPPAHEYYNHGELGVKELFAAVAGADIVVGGVGWLVPFAIAAKVRGAIILGGQGGYNSPEKITHPNWTHNLTFFTPESYCKCSLMKHDCPKEIKDFSERFDSFLKATVSSGTRPPASDTSLQTPPREYMTIDISTITQPSTPQILGSIWSSFELD